MTLLFPTQAPAVSSCFAGVGNTPFSGGSTATLGGLNFATCDLTQTAAVASVDCATLSWSSGTAVNCLWMASVTLASLLETTRVTVASSSGTLDSTLMFSFDGSQTGDTLMIHWHDSLCKTLHSVNHDCHVFRMVWP